MVERASAFLQRKGEAVHSNVLLAVAQKVKEDPFSKVKKMIKVRRGSLHSIVSVRIMAGPFQRQHALRSCEQHFGRS